MLAENEGCSATVQCTCCLLEDVTSADFRSNDQTTLQVDQVILLEDIRLAVSEFREVQSTSGMPAPASALSYVTDRSYRPMVL